MVSATKRRIVHGLDLDRIVAAIRTAERGTSGEIRVAVARFHFWGDVRRAAEAAFARLGMHRTRQRNAVLLYIAPRLRRFAVIGDAGIHQHVTDAFWNDLSKTLGTDFGTGDRTSGLERAIATIGDRLAEHFPPDPHDVNELSDRVDLERPTRR
jgi:uncharacterized membrane protein